MAPPLSPVDRRSVTIVTAIGRTEPPAWQEELQQSVAEFASLRAPSNVRWVRVIDGPSTRVLPADRDIPTNLNVVTLPSLVTKHIGIARTRNRALPHVLEGWVSSVDSDDYLVYRGMAHQLAAMEEADVLWSAALGNDIGADGTVIYEGPNYFPAGMLETGSFLDHTLREGLPPWLCPTTVMDTTLARAAGGWAESAELVRCEDVAFIARVTSFVEGLWVPSVVQVYRKHEGQTTSDPAFLPAPERIDLLEAYATDTSWHACLPPLVNPDVDAASG